MSKAKVAKERLGAEVAAADSDLFEVEQSG